ncbi:hypothetical protein DEAC_c34440 [Desulfosporosinus acididurans]|uniref:Uncharacterized protein n=1 Tax=Desulfosporosinus acididurans TaxID=476652 RepID=A0A0J1IIE5_9FIRM|nr:hypothetical protein [Desulfosporosinus acididurans]KLU64501.1 hypothetical protein DEAC_c34440 [Desulfosporosinus acididurans]
MKKKLIVVVTTMIAGCSIFIGYVISHAHTTPQMAIRTYLFLSEHPISALTTGIVENRFQTELDRNSLELQNAKIYSLTRPPLDVSGNHLINVKVIKKGASYYAQSYGEA